MYDPKIPLNPEPEEQEKRGPGRPPKPQEPTIEEQLAKVRLEQAKYELVEMQERARQRAEVAEERIRRRKQLAQDELRNKHDNEAMQKMCQHRKGGKDREGFMNGNSNDYSVIKHTPSGSVTFSFR